MTARKFIRRFIKRSIVLVPIAYFNWPLVAIYFATGFYDVMRQKNKDKLFILGQYFYGNGTLAWIFSPLNTFIDIISLPFINKQIYTLDQLPKKHREEVETILNEVPKKELNNTLRALDSSSNRSMLFYKWYGFNVETNHPVELFHRKFKTVKTIGISSFNAQAKTDEHFGWLRAGIRVLINIDEDVHEGAYINVNNQKHVWKDDGPLFIFDDTVLHQSVNFTDQKRNVLFIDIRRPSPLPFISNSIFGIFGFISTKVPGFQSLSNWKVLK